MKRAFFVLRFLSAGRVPVLSATVAVYLGSSAVVPANAQQAPTITVQPVSQYVSAGSVVSFSVTVAGAEPLNYRWLKDGIELVDGGKVSGATQATLRVSNVQGVEMGAYSVRVTNADGAATSSGARLYLEPLVAWGRNDYGQATVPFGLTSVFAIAAGPSHNLVVRGDGTVAAWGSDVNYYGYTNVPPGLSTVVAVAAGWQHSLALRSDGTVVGWGYDYYGQSTPPTDLTNAVAIAAGSGHSLALRSDGTVVAWGNDHFGQATVPEGLSGVVAISAGWNYSIALLSNATVVAWGAYDVRGTPVYVPQGLSNVVEVAAGYEHTLALLVDGTVVAWGGGDNYYGQTNVPPGLNSVVQVAAGGTFSTALRNDGALVVWSGRDAGYFLKLPAGLGHVVAVAAGGTHSLALVDVDYHPQLHIRRQGPNAEVSWTGGRGPFQLLQRASLFLPEAWENVGQPVETNTVTLPIDVDVRFLRVLDLAPRR